MFQQLQHLGLRPGLPPADQVGQPGRNQRLCVSQRPGSLEPPLHRLQAAAPLLLTFPRQEKGKLHVAKAEGPALRLHMVQPAGNLIEEGVARGVAEALVDIDKVVQGEQDHLKPLPPRQTQRNLLIKAVSIADSRQAVLFHAAALEAEKQDEIGHGNDGAVEQQLGIEELKEHQQQCHRGQGPHDPHHVPADTGLVFKIAQQQQRQFCGHDAVAQPVERTSLVVPHRIEGEHDPAAQVPQHHRQIDQRQCAHPPPDPAQAALVVHMLQDEAEQV